MSSKRIVLGGGCFWCIEASFQLIRGVYEVEPGYAGGSVPNPDYYAVCSGKTGHAEVVRVEYDPSEISLDEVLDIFWTVHDPTTLNRQDYDTGTAYRSIILYEDDAELPVIEASIKRTQKLWDDPIVTEVKKLDRFYPAEPEHRDYFLKHPEQAYCQIIVNPKLAKLRQTFAARIKP